MIVYGYGKEDFNKNVIAFLDRCVEKDLHLNPDKMRINVPSVPFYGHVVSKDGLSVDPKKIDTIKQWPKPQSVADLQSFLGSVNYLSKFIPRLSDLRKPYHHIKCIFVVPQ